MNIAHSLGRPDVRRNPVRALWRRFWWHLRWRVRRAPWLLPWHEGLRLHLPREGASALIYYQGYSEPETADFIGGYLKPGMVFVDVGAHIGEYTLLAARRVGSQGEVHAFEPNPAVHSLLVENVRLNDLAQVVLLPWAVSDVEGEVEMALDPEPALAALVPRAPDARPTAPILRVRSVTLDGYAGHRRVDLIKIDVEGAELLVLRGARGLLQRPGAEAPVIVFECAAHTFARFEYAPPDLFRFLRDLGYGVWRYERPGAEVLPAVEPPAGVTINLIATKDPTRLPGRPAAA